MGPFAPGAFRLDLSGMVSEGKSWQLAVFVAHALARDGLLASPGETYGSAILLSGEVDNDLQIRSVTDVPEKLHASLPLLNSILAEGKKVFVFLPQENMQVLKNAGLPTEVVAKTFLPISELLDSIGIPFKSIQTGPTVPGTPPNTVSGRWKVSFLFVFIGIIALALIILFLEGTLTLEGISKKALVEKGDALPVIGHAVSDGVQQESKYQLLGKVSENEINAKIGENPSGGIKKINIVNHILSPAT